MNKQFSMLLVLTCMVFITGCGNDKSLSSQSKSQQTNSSIPKDEVNELVRLNTELENNRSASVCKTTRKLKKNAFKYQIKDCKLNIKFTKQIINFNQCIQQPVIKQSCLNKLHKLNKSFKLHFQYERKYFKLRKIDKKSKCGWALRGGKIPSQSIERMAKMSTKLEKAIKEGNQVKTEQYYKSFSSALMLGATADDKDKRSYAEKLAPCLK